LHENPEPGAELDVIMSHDFVAVPAHIVLIEMRKHDEAGGGNAEIRRALWARDFCLFEDNIGHSNEVDPSFSHPEPPILNLTPKLPDPDS
jgi:hypothetical protein